MPGWAYACHLCGNKRCPHHANHRFRCTASNEPDQVGVLIEGGGEEGVIFPLSAPSAIPHMVAVMDSNSRASAAPSPSESALQARVAELEAALGFYADAKNWEATSAPAPIPYTGAIQTMIYFVPAATSDGGAKARAALGQKETE